MPFGNHRLLDRGWLASAAVAASAWLCSVALAQEPAAAPGQEAAPSVSQTSPSGDSPQPVKSPSEKVADLVSFQDVEEIVDVEEIQESKPVPQATATPRAEVAPALPKPPAAVPPSSAGAGERIELVDDAEIVGEPTDIEGQTFSDGMVPLPTDAPIEPGSGPVLPAVATEANAPVSGQSAEIQAAAALLAASSGASISAGPSGEMVQRIGVAAPANAPGILSGNVMGSASPIPNNYLMYRGGGITQTGCSTCGGGFANGPDLYVQGGLGVAGGISGDCRDNQCVGVDAAGCCVANCYPGKDKCFDYDDSHFFARAIGVMYECICCVDPCYELSGPHWDPVGNAAMFVDHARPRSQTRLRWDDGRNMVLPDRNAWFWAQENTIGPNTIAYAAQVAAQKQATNPGYVPPPPQGVASLNYDDLSMYVETATSNRKFSAFVYTPYRAVDPDQNFNRHAAFSDIEVGTKSLLFDCELIQITFQMKTFIPVGVSINGTGTGHVSIEPSVLYAVKLAQDCYLEGQVSEWIPFGAPNGGGILHLHHAVNKCLWALNPDVKLIGSLELNNWNFQGGTYTDPITLLPVSSSGGRYFSLGLGCRLVFCNSIDFGLGFAQALGDEHFADQLYRSELRILY